MTEPAYTNAAELFDGIADYISQCNRLLEQGKLVELNGLDEQIAALCEAVMNLTQEERVEYADRLQWLLNGLNALGKDMIEKRNALSVEMQGSNSHKKASVAYRTANSVDGGGPKDN